MNLVFFSKDVRVMGLWFGAGLEQALAARAVLGQLQAEHPDAGWMLFGPKAYVCLFEMDDLVQAYVPLLSLEPRRPGQSRFSRFLERRAQNRQLTGLKLQFCFGVAAATSVNGNANVAGLAQKAFDAFLQVLKAPGRLIQNDLEVFLAHKRPVLQAGPQALAFATQLYRQTPPNCLKKLILLDGEQSEDVPQAPQWQNALAPGKQHLNTHTTTALVLGAGRLSARRIGREHPDCLLIDLAEAMGLLAYADRVVCFSPELLLICAEMERVDRLVLDKSDS